MKLSIHNLTLQRDHLTLVRDLDLTITAGECWALLGPNGCGKSTLLHTLAALLPPPEGANMTLLDRPLHTWPRRELARHLGLLPQDPTYPFPLRVEEAVAAGRAPHHPLWQPIDHPERVTQALTMSATTALRHRAIDSLSGGERQRVAIATLLCQDPHWLLLDEPLNHLDLHYQYYFLHHFAELAQSPNRRGVMMALHDPNHALAACSHVLLLDGMGGWQAGRCEEILSASRVGQVYGVEMIAVAVGSRFRLLPAARNTTPFTSPDRPL
jgi:iron complex transport system ATP-binding protein